MQHHYLRRLSNFITIGAAILDDDDDDWCLMAHQHYVGYVVPSLFNNYTLVNNTVDRYIHIGS